MNILKIAKLGNPILRKIACELSIEELKTDEIQRLIDDMIITMREHNGAGISAPQVHHSLRIVMVELDSDNKRYPNRPKIPLIILINPKITILSNETTYEYEGCLSVDNLRAKVRRAREIRVEAIDRYGNSLDFIAKDFFAKAILHEIDHLNGEIFIEKIEDFNTLSHLVEFEKFHAN